MCDMTAALVEEAGLCEDGTSVVEADTCTVVLVTEAETEDEAVADTEVADGEVVDTELAGTEVAEDEATLVWVLAALLV